DVDQVLARLLQLRERRRVAVDEAARAAGFVDRPAQEDFSRIALQLTIAKPILKSLVGIKLRGQVSALGALAHHRGVAAAADQQLDGVDQDRLAGAGLAGEHAEARAELDRDLAEDDEVVNVERPQHGYSRSRVLSSTSLQRSFSRRVAK